MPQEIPSSEAVLARGTSVFSRVDKQKKLLLIDCHETACKQLDSKVFAQGKKNKKVGKSIFLPALLTIAAL